MYNVLITDDDEIIREGIKRLIPWEEFNVGIVSTAANGKEALAYMSENKVDILITDVSMPEMSGIDLIRNAKKIQMQIKCIVISAYNEFSYVKEAAKLGIENYILKPIDEQELANTITSAVEKLDTESTHLETKEQGSAVLKSTILSRLLYGEIDEFELMEKAEFLQFNLYAGEYLLCYLKLTSGGIQRAFGDKLGALFRFYDDMNTFWLQDLEENYVLIFSGDDLKNKDILIKERISKNIRYLEEDFSCRINITRSEYVNSYKNLPECYRITRRLQNDQRFNSASHMLIQRIVEYVHQNYMEDINLKTISYEFGMNAFYVGQLFKEDMKTNFTEYLTNLRIEKAKKLLSEGKYKACEVSLLVGYSNINYFYTLFKKKTGCSPSNFGK